MEALGTAVLVVVILAGAIGAIRRDARFDRREIVIQVAWIAAYLAACAALAWLLVPLGRRIGAGAATVIGLAVIALGMVVLARYLGKRLKRRRL